MAATPRELVHQTLAFEQPARAPRNLWVLPIARLHQPAELEAIERDFPGDMIGINGHERERAKTVGDPHEVGEYVDEWGCRFVNLQRGVIGEVKAPLIEDWGTDAERVHIPVEHLTIDADAVNRQCAATDRFTGAGRNVTFFERLQWVRGPEMLMMDLADPPAGMRRFMDTLHRYNCDLLRTWCRTEIDKVTVFDDWGSQRALLISPAMWRELFKPVYRDYAQIAHAAGKKVFMHSDGHIAAIYEDLVEIGIDAVNSQVFCMGVEALEPFAGRITFWGEIDRQHLLARGTAEQVAAAVRGVHARLWRGGGCIAQCEFGAAAKPENIRAVFQTWDALFEEGEG